MISQLRTCLLFLFFWSTGICHAETFSEFNAKVSVEHSTDKLNIYALEELKKYTETGNVYYLYN